jgi:hypothetical protein
VSSCHATYKVRHQKSLIGPGANCVAHCTKPAPYKDYRMMAAGLQLPSKRPPETFFLSLDAKTERLQSHSYRPQCTSHSHHNIGNAHQNCRQYHGCSLCANPRYKSPPPPQTHTPTDTQIQRQGPALPSSTRVNDLVPTHPTQNNGGAVLQMIAINRPTNITPIHPVHGTATLIRTHHHHTSDPDVSCQQEARRDGQPAYTDYMPLPSEKP